MPDTIIKTPNGKMVNDAVLKEKYGNEQYNQYLSDGTFSVVDEPVYKTPNGRLVTEGDIKAKYGDRANELLSNDTFKLEYSPKKKVGPEGAVSNISKVASGAPEMDSPSEPSSEPSTSDTPNTKSPDTVKKEAESWGKNLFRQLETGSADLGEMMASIPESLYNIFALPQNLFSEATGVDVSASADKFKEDYGIENKVLDFYTAEVEKLEGETEAFNKERYDKTGIWENIKEGNYTDAFELLGSGITRSAPVSLAMMAGGAATGSAAKLSATSTPLFMEQNYQDLKRDNPEMEEAELTIKALGMAGAETVFASIGTGTIGKVYKDIVLKEGAEQGAKIFKQGLIQSYETALKKYGIPTAMAGEGIEEVATTITQNMISGRDPMENVADSFLQGVGGGALYGTPLTASKVRNSVVEAVASNRVNKKLTDTDFESISDVYLFDNNELTNEALELSENEVNKKVLEKKLSKEISNGKIDSQGAVKALANFDKARNIWQALNGIELDADQKTQAAKLLIEKQELINQTKGKDPFLVKVENDRINEINESLANIRKPKDEAGVTDVDDTNFFSRFKRKQTKTAAYIFYEELHQKLKDKPDNQLTDQEKWDKEKAKEFLDDPIAFTVKSIESKKEMIKEIQEDVDKGLILKETAKERIDLYKELIKDDKEDLAVYEKQKSQDTAQENETSVPKKVVNSLSENPNEIKTQYGDRAFNYTNSNGIEVTLTEDLDEHDVNGRVVQADFIIDFIGNKNDKRGDGLASKEIDRVLNEADKNNLSVGLIVDSDTATTNVVGEKTNANKSNLSNDQLKEWYKRKGFVFSEDSNYGYRPAKNDSANYDQKTHTAKNGEIKSEGDIKEFYSDPETMFDDFKSNTNKEIGYYEGGNDKLYYWNGKELKTVSNVSVNWTINGFKFNYNGTAPTTDTNVDEGAGPGTEVVQQEGTTQGVQQTVDLEAGQEQAKVTTKEVKSVKGASYDVDIDESGSVTEIRSKKDGRVIEPFTERTRKDGTKYLHKNANWSRIESDALGIKTEGREKADNQKKLQNFEPVTAMDHAQDFFAKGGKVSLDSAKKETGERNTKAVRWATGKRSEKNLPSVERAAEMIVEESNIELDVQEVRDALIETILRNESVNDVKRSIVEQVYAIEQETQRQQAEAYLNSLSAEDFAMYEAVKAEESYLSELSDQEKIEYFENEYEKRIPTGQQEAQEQTGNVKGDSVQERNGAQTEEKQVNLSEDLGLNDFIDRLDKIDKDLRDFGRETLGMNLPISVASAAVKAMKLAALTAKTVADITSAGLNAVKQTNWYKNLTQQQQNDVDANFLQYLNNPTVNTERSRFDIEQEVDDMLASGTSESDVIDSFTTKRERMIATDHIERKKSITPKQALEKVNKEHKKSTDKLNDKQIGNKVNHWFRKFANRFFDRQFVPKFLLMMSGGKLVRNYIVAAKGASGYARMMFEDAYKDIYFGLSEKKLDALDKIIMLRRFIAIDKNRAENNLPLVVHQGYINGESSQQAFDEMKKELGDKVFDDLNKRASEYFNVFRGVLDDMHKEGLISKETRDRFFEVDYQPRMFLDFVKDKEDNVINEMGENRSSKGLGTKQIQKFTDGLETELIWDSQLLLNRTIAVHAQSIATNRVNFKFSEFIQEQAKKIEALKQKKNPTKKEKQQIKYFDELSQNVRLNPIVDFNKNGDPVYAYSTPKGWANAYYYVNGVKHIILMKQDFHDQYYDNVSGFWKNGKAKERAAILSGTALVKNLATGNNPTFFLSNAPRDLLFIATFSEEYGWFLPKNIMELITGFVKGSRDIYKESDRFRNFVKFGGMMDYLHRQGRYKDGFGIGTMISKYLGNRASDYAGKAFNAVTLSRFQMYSEIGFRMAVFNKSISNQLSELGYKNERELRNAKPDEADNIMRDVYTNAVASARNTTDFNQGGTITKDADALIPYLNASAQGTRVMLDNFRERPAETSFRYVQASAMVASVPIFVSLALLGSLDDDEVPDELKGKSSMERYLWARKGISKYERSNYMIFFDGTFNEIGEANYWRLAKSHGITPGIALAENLMVETMKSQVGDNSESRLIEDLSFTLDNNVMPLEVNPTKTITRVPFIKAFMSYSTGYDFFREKPFSYQQGSVFPSEEGYENPMVEDFYKDIGYKYKISPARMKGAVESMITSPSTTPYVGALYGGMDALYSDKDAKEVLKKLKKDIERSSLRRIRKETNDFNRRLTQNQKMKDKIEARSVEDTKTKYEFKRLVDSYNKGEVTKNELKDKIIDVYKESPYDGNRMFKKAVEMIQNKDVSPYVFELKYAEPKDRAIMLVEIFGDDLNGKNVDKKLRNQMVVFGVFTEETMYEYKKLTKKNKK